MTCTLVDVLSPVNHVELYQGYDLYMYFERSTSLVIIIIIIKAEIRKHTSW